MTLKSLACDICDRFADRSRYLRHPRYSRHDLDDRFRFYRMIVAAVGGFLLMGGCSPSTPRTPPTVDRHVPPPVVTPPSRVEPTPAPEPVRTVTKEKVVVGRSVAGQPITCTIIGSGHDVVLIMATIHGNEAAGTPLVHRLASHLTAHPEVVEGRQILLMPVANPDGLDRNSRHNLRGVDLNRNFPSDNFDSSKRHGPRPLSEPESTAIYELIERYEPNRVVSIHQPVECVDYDGPAESLAVVMARACGLPVRRLGSRPGSLGSYVGLERNTPIITFEWPRAADRLSDDAKWERYGPALLAAITHDSVVAK